MIRVLSTHLVNKIAAGEVIERPASVVKELIENALDAGASAIDVAVEDGGRACIAVTDDGCGMAAEDVALAFRPHATSKIADEEDLYRIGTMGFRGEALASIASISHAHLRTRRRTAEGAEDSGHEVEASGETIGPVRPCAAGPGTTVTVRDLFFNTPARRKFLKSVGTEFGHVVEQIARLALPHCRVAFSLSHNGRQVLALPAAASTAQRASELFGRELADGLIPIAARGQKVKVAGLIAPPSAARSSNKWQYMFLNGRYIRDRLLGHALREAFRGLTDPSRWPVAMLFIEVDPQEVDVNVHPTKIEVRFRDSQMVYGEVLAALRETLNRSNLTPAAALENPGERAGAQPPSAQEEARRQSLREAMADFFKSVPPPQPRLSFPESTPFRRPAGQAWDPAHAHRPPTPPMGAAGASPPWAHGGGTTARPLGAPPVVRPAEGEAPPGPTPAAPRHAAIQVHGSYIVAACEDGLLIVDQHALHERILYNELRQRVTEGRLASQRMLIPETFTVTPGEMAALQAHQPLLSRLGIEAEPFGPASAAVQQFPTLLAGRGVSAVEFLRDFLDGIGEGRSADAEAVLEGLLQLMACKAAVKAGQPLGPAEIDDLLDRREVAEKSSACPHGRPTSLKLTLKDLEKQFKRT